MNDHQTADFPNVALVKSPESSSRSLCTQIGVLASEVMDIWLMRGWSTAEIVVLYKNGIIRLAMMMVLSKSFFNLRAINCLLKMMASPKKVISAYRLMGR